MILDLLRDPLGPGVDQVGKLQRCRVQHLDGAFREWHVDGWESNDTFVHEHITSTYIAVMFESNLVILPTSALADSAEEGSSERSRDRRVLF